MMVMLNNLPITDFQLRQIRGNKSNHNISYIKEIQAFVESKDSYKKLALNLP